MARNSEAQIQAAIVAWARTCAPQAICFSVPNGGLRSKREAALLKWTGVLAGVPDLCVLACGEPHFIEVKAEKGRPSLEQNEFFASLDDQNIPWIIARSIDDVRAAFDIWGIETREVAA